MFIEEYLDESKENVINFKAMVKHYGLDDTLVEIPITSIELVQEIPVTTEDAHALSIGATHEDKVMFIKYVVDEFKKNSAGNEQKLELLAEELQELK